MWYQQKEVESTWVTDKLSLGGIPSVEQVQHMQHNTNTWSKCMLLTITAADPRLITTTTKNWMSVQIGKHPTNRHFKPCCCLRARIYYLWYVRLSLKLATHMSLGHATVTHVRLSFLKLGWLYNHGFKSHFHENNACQRNCWHKSFLCR